MSFLIKEPKINGGKSCDELLKIGKRKGEKCMKKACPASDHLCLIHYRKSMGIKPKKKEKKEVKEPETPPQSQPVKISIPSEIPESNKETKMKLEKVPGDNIVVDQEDIDFSIPNGSDVESDDPDCPDEPEKSVAVIDNRQPIVIKLKDDEMEDLRTITDSKNESESEPEEEEIDEKQAKTIQRNKDFGNSLVWTGFVGAFSTIETINWAMCDRYKWKKCWTGGLTENVKNNPDIHDTLIEFLEEHESFEKFISKLSPLNRLLFLMVVTTGMTIKNNIGSSQEPHIGPRPDQNLNNIIPEETKKMILENMKAQQPTQQPQPQKTQEEKVKEDQKLVDSTINEMFKFSSQ